MTRALTLALLFWLSNRCMPAEQTILASEAAKHVGEKAAVCGVVASARYASRSKGQPTFLNLDKPYPKAVFTDLIWGEDRSKFNEPEVRLREKRICTTGTITSYRGTPEMVLKEPSQIQAGAIAILGRFCREETHRQHTTGICDD